MDVITPIITLLERLLNPVSIRVSNVVNLNKRVNVLTRELKKLSQARDDVKMRIEQAELEGLKPTNEVTGWFEDVEAVEVKVFLVVDQLAQRTRCRWTSGYAPPAVEMIPTRPIIGQEIIKQKVRQCLEDDQVGIIGIYGMGGSGKTTLGKKLTTRS